MDLIKCPVCGEKYSSSYRRCPFCEEEDRPRKVSGKRRGGHHVAERKHTHSARGPLIAVLLVVLVVFSWYLFGGKFMEKIQEDRANDVENVDPAPVDPTPVDPTPVDPTPDDPTPDEPTPPVVHDPDERFHSAHSARHRRGGDVVERGHLRGDGQRGRQAQAGQGRHGQRDGERRRNHGPLRGAHQQLKADRERPLGVVL